MLVKVPGGVETGRNIALLSMIYDVLCGYICENYIHLNFKMKPSFDNLSFFQPFVKKMLVILEMDSVE